MSDILRARTGIDTVLTEVAYSAYQAESLIPFIAPTVLVATETGRIVTFDRSNFAVSSTKRSPYAHHKTSKVSGYDTSLAYVLEQHTHRAEVSWREIDAAGEGALNIDLKELAIMDAMNRIEQSLEQELYSLVTNPANYETGLAFAAAGTQQFSDQGSDPEALVLQVKSNVRSQIGRYPTRAVIAEDVYRALVLHPIFRERTKHTQVEATSLDLIASWLGFDGGIEVANRLKEDPATGELVDMFPQGTMLMFVDARDRVQSLGSLEDQSSFSMYKPVPGIMQNTATFAQFYVQRPGLTVGREIINEDNDTVSHTVRVTGGIVLPSVGATNKSAAGALITNLI